MNTKRDRPDLDRPVSAPDRATRRGGPKIQSGTADVPTKAAHIQPYHGDEDMDPMSSHVPPTHFEAWEWVSLRPVEYTKIDEVWSKWITPLRAPALAWLWITYRWWRVAALVATIAAVILTFKLS